MNRRTFLRTSATGLIGLGTGFSSLFKPSQTRGIGNGPVDRATCAEFINGPISSICTPFKRDGSVSYDGLRSFIDHAIAGDSKTMLLTAGDSHLGCMSDKEIAEVARVTAEHTAGRALVVAADDGYATPEAIEFAQYCKSVGVDVVMLKPPDSFESGTVETFVQHYVEVSRYVPVMLVSNVLGNRGHDFALEVVRRSIEQSKSIVSMKNDSGHEFGRNLSRLCQGTGVIPFAGGGKKAHFAVVPVDGGPSYMSTFQVGAPHISREYWRATQAKDLKRAEEIIEQYETPYWDYLKTLQGGWNAGWHGALELFGVAGRWRRKPYYSLNDEELEGLKQRMIELDILRS